jgi:GNAT superfamily N-acetyltransferase
MTATGHIKIQCIKIKDVYDFTCKAIDSRKPGEVVPASRWRSLAWTRNPYADRDDVSLIVAYRNSSCVGYLGLMPGRMWIKGRFEKVYWLSTFYVPKELRHTAVGAMLVMRALALRKDILAINSSLEAAQMYEALRFKPLGPLYYMSATLTRYNILGFPLRAIRKLLHKLAGRPTRVLDGLIRTADWLFKKLVYAPLGTKITPILTEILTKRVEQINDRSFERHQHGMGSMRFVRSPDVINWMLKDRWVTSNLLERTDGYFFSDFDPLFHFRAFEIYGEKDRRYKGFMVLRIDEKFEKRTVTVFDHFFYDPSDYRYLLPVALEQAKNVLAGEINLPQECRDSIQQWWLLRWLFRKAECAYFYYPAGANSPLNGALDEIKLDLSDGDMAFA